MPGKILVIDDSHTIAKALELFLKPKGYLIELAHNGKDGIKIAKTSHPDLIFLDIEMPEMNGFETLLELKKFMNHEYSSPIIMLSANNSPNDVLKSVKYGAQDYVVKPFDEKRLEEKLNKYLSP